MVIHIKQLGGKLIKENPDRPPVYGESTVKSSSNRQPHFILYVNEEGDFIGRANLTREAVLGHYNDKEIIIYEFPNVLNHPDEIKNAKFGIGSINLTEKPNFLDLGKVYDMNLTTVNIQNVFSNLFIPGLYNFIIQNFDEIDKKAYPYKQDTIDDCINPGIINTIDQIKKNLGMPTINEKEYKGIIYIKNIN